MLSCIIHRLAENKNKKQTFNISISNFLLFVCFPACHCQTLCFFRSAFTFFCRSVFFLFVFYRSVGLGLSLCLSALYVVLTFSFNLFFIFCRSIISLVLLSSYVSVVFLSVFLSFFSSFCRSPFLFLMIHFPL